MKLKLLVVATLTFFASTAVFGAGLADKKKWKKADDDMKEQVADARKSCGNKVAVTFDQPTFNASWNETLSIGGSCGNAVEALASVCKKDADSKKAGSKITKIKCKAGKTASLKVAGGAMNYVMDYASGGMTSAAIETELENQL